MPWIFSWPAFFANWLCPELWMLPIFNWDELEVASFLKFKDALLCAECCGIWLCMPVVNCECSPLTDAGCDSFFFSSTRSLIWFSFWELSSYDCCSDLYRELLLPCCDFDSSNLPRPMPSLEPWAPEEDWIYSKLNLELIYESLWCELLLFFYSWWFWASFLSC